MIAGGGTGGHLFPALAMAEAFLEKDRRNQILFVGSQKGLERQVLGKQGFALKTIEAASLVGKPWGKKIGTFTFDRQKFGTILATITFFSS